MGNIFSVIAQGLGLPSAQDIQAQAAAAEEQLTIAFEILIGEAAIMIVLLAIIAIALLRRKG